MRYFFDCKCIEDGSTIALISIGMVAEDGRKLYFENEDADLSKASEWVAKNVVYKLWSRQPDKREFNAWVRDGGVGGLRTHKEIAREVRHFCDPQTHGIPEFWRFYETESSCAAFRQLIGSLKGLPPDDPMDFRSIKQLWIDLGNPPLPVYKDLKHHALADAERGKKAWHLLQDEADRLLDKAKAAN